MSKVELNFGIKLDIKQVDKIKLNPNQVVSSKVNSRKHIYCVKVSDGYKIRIHELLSTKIIPNLHNRRIIKVYKDVAINVLDLYLSEETINTIFLLSNTLKECTNENK